MNALRPMSFPLLGTRLIEASAGTGKTYTIAALYVRLVLGHGGEAAFERSLLPPEILVVTFTEAAKEELRERIRHRLTEAAACLRGTRAPGDPFLTDLLADYSEQRRPGAARLLELAAEWMDEAAIYTIHGFCNRMLRQHAFDSGSLFNLDLGSDDRSLLEEAAQDYWRSLIQPLSAAPLRELRHQFETPLSLLQAVQPLLAHTDGDVVAAEPEGFTAWQQAVGDLAALEAKARVAWRADSDAIEHWVEDALREKWLNGNSYRANSVPEHLQQLRRWSEGAALDPATKVERYTAAGLAQGLKKAHQDQAPDCAGLRALQDWLEAQQQLPPIDLALRRHAAVWIGQRFAEAKRRRAQLDFDDMLQRLDQALAGANGPRLAELIRQQYPVAMIDEFQDTDPVQYRIFRTLYVGRADTGFFMIGDPKQAIYSFRGADIHTYLAAKADCEAHYSLDTNFRSTAGLVGAVNDWFNAAAAYPQGAFLFEPIPFEAVKAKGRKEVLEVDGQPLPALTCWHRASDEPISATAYTDELAEATAAEITRLLNLGAEGRAGFRGEEASAPLRPADIAVLVRGWQEAAAVRTALARRRVKSVYLSDRDSVFASPEAADLLHWLAACAEPDNDRRVRSALATRTLGRELAWLDRLNHDERLLEQQLERFRLYRDLWHRRGVLPMLRALLRHYRVPVHLLQQRDDGERALTNLLHLAELAQTASIGLDGEQGLLRWLAERVHQAAGDDNEEQVLRLESDADLVKVVTIHKSKGLEYPLVFLPFISRARPVDGSKLPVMVPAPQGGQRALLEPTDEEIRLADRERLAEDLRLLYVALTRPRHACWLGAASLKVGNRKECRMHTSALGYLLNGGEPIGAERLGELLAARASERTVIAPLPAAEFAPLKPLQDVPQLEPARTFQGRIPRDWWIASYSALAVTGAVPVQPAAPDSAPADILAEAVQTEWQQPELFQPTDTRQLGDIHQFPRGPAAGVLLHGLLEKAAVEEFAAFLANNEYRARVLQTRLEGRGWQDWAGTVEAWLAALLQTPLPLPAIGNEPVEPLALAELSRRQYQPELEFLFAASQVSTGRLDALVSEHTLAGAPRPALQEQRVHGMLKGYIDLVFEHQGRYYVADYKSNWLGDGPAAYTPEAMQRVVLDKRYDLQFVLYTLALHRLLRARLSDYDYDRHVGGALYLFVRGIDAPSRGLLWERPSRELIETLDQLFAGGRTDAA